MNCPRKLHITASPVLVDTTDAESVVSLTWNAVTKNFHGGCRVCG